NLLQGQWLGPAWTCGGLSHTRPLRWSPSSGSRH
uniref:Uncharacterized protein n=1 Tax=Dicentrarchus labrax TaxID=13489 RepID=A0A8P4K793_DICLA